MVIHPLAPGTVVTITDPAWEGLTGTIDPPFSNMRVRPEEEVYALMPNGIYMYLITIETDDDGIKRTHRTAIQQGGIGEVISSKTKNPA